MAYNRRGGRVSQKKGAAFENFISNICTYLKNHKIAWITKKDTAIGVQCGKVFYKKKSTVDFEGFLINDGRHVCFECKNIEGKEKYIFNKEHQIEYLYSAWIAGCSAFLLLYTGNGLYKFIPDDSWQGKKNMTFHFSDGVHISWDRVYDFLDI